MEEIIPRIINDNTDELTQPSSVHRAECLLVINDLISSLQAFESGFLSRIADSGPDLQLWQDVLSAIPDEKRNWRDAPWVVSEFYLYRRIVEAFKFFETGYDPFSRQKVSGLIEALPNIQEIAGRLPGLLGTDDKVAIIELAVLTSLWGNKMDLSLWPASKAQSGNDRDIESTERINEALSSNKPLILDDHSEEVTRRLLKTVEKASGSKGSVDIVVDNAGYELVSDMILGHCLLAAGVCDSVRFHTKAHPTFVSDATNEDCLGTIGLLMDNDDQATAALARSAEGAVRRGWPIRVHRGSILVPTDGFLGHARAHPGALAGHPHVLREGRCELPQITRRAPVAAGHSGE